MSLRAKMLYKHRKIKVVFRPRPIEGFIKLPLPVCRPVQQFSGGCPIIFSDFGRDGR